MDRRSFLRSIGGLAASVPLLSSLRAANAGDLVFPPRFVVFFHPNGTMPGDWWPKRAESETDFDLNVIHEPLQPFKDKLVLFRGIDLAAGNAGPGEPHQKGMGSLLTGRELLEGEFIGGDGSLAGWGSGISVDQEIANLISGQTARKSLELGVRATSAEVRARISYLGSSRPLPPQNDPTQLFEGMFSDFSRPQSENERHWARRRSVLDAATKQIGLMMPKLSSEDRTKLGQHLELVEQVERRLRPGAASCEVPGRPATLDPDSEETMPAVMDSQIELLVMALACDLTRVASLQVSNAQNQIRYPWLDSEGVGHSLSHSGPSDVNAHDEWVRRDTWLAGRLAHMMTLMSQIPEGDGTLLDHTLIFWGNELSVGNTHSQTNMPFLLAGGGSGRINTGRYLQLSTARPHNDLLVTLLQAFGSEATQFGNRNFNTGLIPGLLK
ncbi:MAG: DUF1552 domain-containing protein [Deltaproteobacteria bacterium]|nr:DUF1552 domain-containing protein [Deltaproteobacteria bacterium]